MKEKKTPRYIRLDASAWDVIDLEAHLLLEVKHAQAIVFGTPSLKSRKTEDTLLELIDYGLTKVMDIHFDKSMPSEDTIKLLMQKSDIIKINKSDFDTVANWYQLTGSFEEKMMQLYKKLELEILVVNGPGCKAHVIAFNTVYNHQGFPIEILDPRGAEDAFFAGFLAALFDGKEIEIALSEACAIGAFVATKHGASPNYRKDDIGMA